MHSRVVKVALTNPLCATCSVLDPRVAQTFVSLDVLYVCQIKSSLEKLRSHNC